MCIVEYTLVVRITREGRSPSLLPLQYEESILLILLLSYVFEGGLCVDCVFRLVMGIRVVVSIP